MTKKIIAAAPEPEQVPEIEIERDSCTRRWCICMGSHRYETPCFDVADARAWIQGRANGRIIVVVRV